MRGRQGERKTDRQTEKSSLREKKNKMNRNTDLSLHVAISHSSLPSGPVVRDFALTDSVSFESKDPLMDGAGDVPRQLFVVYSRSHWVVFIP